LNFVSRALNSLRGIRLDTGVPADETPAQENVLQWVLAVWAEQGRRTGLPVRGMSMWPLLRSGERVVVRHGGASPRVGQVVVVLQGRRTIAHRVIAVRMRAASFEVRTKGDFTLVADPGWFGPDRLVGVIEGIECRDGLRQRTGLQGFTGRCVARLSRLQGALCTPLRALRRRDPDRHVRPGCR
jgi:hypothetical protein